MNPGLFEGADRAVLRRTVFPTRVFAALCAGRTMAVASRPERTAVSMSVASTRSISSTSGSTCLQVLEQTLWQGVTDAAA